MRTLGIDFGEKRIGLAISDPEGRLALPLEVVERTDDRTAASAIAEIVEREEVTSLVVGEPKRLDGSEGAAARRARAFAQKLAATTGLPWEMVDESLTSREAASRLRQAGIDPTRHPERVDVLSAQILLQEALDRRSRDRK